MFNQLRSVVCIALVTVITLGPLAGCEYLEPRTTSPFTGQRVTSAQLIAEASKSEAERQALATKTTSEAAAAATKEATTARLEQESDDAALEAELARLTSDVEANRLSMLASYKAKTNHRIAALASSQADRAAALATFTASQTAARDGIDAQLEAGLQSIEQQKRMVTAGFGVLKSIPVVGQYVSAAGVDPLVSAFTGAGAVGVPLLTAGALSRRRRKAEDEKYDADADTDRKAQRDREDRLYDEAFEKGRQAAEAAFHAHQSGTMLKLALASPPSTVVIPEAA